MIIKINEKGIIENVQHSRLIQGSSNINKITLFAKVDTDYYAHINFKLTDSDYSAPMELQPFEEGGYNCWEYSVTSGITKNAGKIQLAIQLGKGDIIIKSPMLIIPIEESIGEGEAIEDPDTLNDLFEAINGRVSFSYLEGTLLDYVQKEEGKTLSSNDYTTPEKDKVSLIPSDFTDIIQKVRDTPSTENILTTIKAVMAEGYLVDKPKSLTTREWVLTQIEAVTGVALEGYIDQDQFAAFIRDTIDPAFLDFDTNIAANTQNISNNTQNISSNTQNIDILHTSVTDNTQAINTLETNVTDNAQAITTLWNRGVSKYHLATISSSGPTSLTTADLNAYSLILVELELKPTNTFITNLEVHTVSSTVTPEVFSYTQRNIMGGICYIGESANPLIKTAEDCSSAGGTWEPTTSEYAAYGGVALYFENRSTVDVSDTVSLSKAYLKVSNQNGNLTAYMPTGNSNYTIQMHIYGIE